MHKIGKTFIVSLGPPVWVKAPCCTPCSRAVMTCISPYPPLPARPARVSRTAWIITSSRRMPFRDMIAADAFLEYAEYVGNFYGTPKMYVDDAMARGKDVILDIERQGAVQVCAKRPETVRIFIAPPSWDELERRLTARGT